MPPKVYMAIRGTNRVRSTEERAAKTQVTRTSLCFDSQLKACGMQVVDSCYMFGYIDQWCYFDCCRWLYSHPKKAPKEALPLKISQKKKCCHHSYIKFGPHTLKDFTEKTGQSNSISAHGPSHAQSPARCSGDCLLSVVG